MHHPDPRRGPRVLHGIALLACAVLLAQPTAAPGMQGAGAEESSRAESWPEDSYRRPPEAVQHIFEVDKDIPALEYASPDRDRFLVPRYTELSTLERMARPTLRLAMLELRGDVGRTWQLDTYGIHGLGIFDLGSRSWTEVDLPDGMLVGDMLWSPDGGSIAFLGHEQGAPTRVWVADAASGAAEPVADTPVLATLATGAQGTEPRWSEILQWTPEGTLITLLAPPDRGPEPRERLATSPVIRTTRDDPAPNPTWPFLLRDEHEAELFRYHTTSVIAEVAPGAAPRIVGEPGMYASLSLSPDGDWLLAERIVEPLSPITAAYGFGRHLEVIAVEDGAVASTLRERPLREGRARGDDPDRELPREVAWVPGRDATLAWLQLELPDDHEHDDELREGRAAPSPGDDGEEDDPVDRIFLLEAPFAMDEARALVSTEDGLADLLFSATGDLALAHVTREDGDDRTLTAWDATVVGPPGTDLLPDHDPEDVLGLPGEPLVVRTANGLRHAVLDGAGDAVYLAGDGYREDFRWRPFIDRQPLDGGDAVRLFQGAADAYERPLVALDADLRRMIVSRESPSRVPDSFLWTRTGDGTPVPRGETAIDDTAGGATDGGSAADRADEPAEPAGQAPAAGAERGGAPADWENLTANTDPFPEITGVERFHFSFTRRDGLEIQARISMPVGWQEGERVPAIFWTYPREYRTERAYRREAYTDRNRNAYNRLSYLRWSEIWLTQGYALVSPDVPIVGDPYNDNYIGHLRDSLYAAMRAVDRRGWVDIDRIGHGGHSYGAFATANLLARTPFFKAGIAGNGAYNRTLTPMGFQREPRFVWEARDTYLEMSPFFAADHIDTPLLMYHGADDDNTGTWPMQSRRMIQALTGLGKEAVLYLYPYESHTPRAKVTYLDLWARWLDWFDRHVKGAAR